MPKMAVLDRRQHMRRDITQRYALRCPAACAAPPAIGQAEAARLIGQHASVCPNPGPAWRPVPGGAVVRPMIYADRVG